jgi:hypothetical protein
MKGQMQPIRTRLLIASLALLAAAGCGDSSGPGEPEDRGVLLFTGVAGPSDIVWTRDGAEVVYAVATSLNAVSATTHLERHLVSDPSISIKGTSSAGDRIYFGAVVTTSPSTAFRVSRINPTAGGAEILTTRAWSGLDYVLVSADERFVAADGSLYDLQASTRIDLPCTRPRGFSPDATRLLCQNPFGPAPESPFSLVSTADGSSQPMHVGPSGPFYFGHRWEGNSPQLLDYAVTNGTTRIYETDGVTGATRDVAQLDGDPTFLLLANWSPDGRTLGAWIEQGPGGNRTAKLYVIHSGSAPVVAASASTSFYFGPDRPVFSGSGNSVAYFYNDENGGRSLYAKTGI